MVKSKQIWTCWCIVLPISYKLKMLYSYCATLFIGTFQGHFKVSRMSQFSNTPWQMVLSINTTTTIQDRDFSKTILVTWQHCLATFLDITFQHSMQLAGMIGKTNKMTLVCWPLHGLMTLFRAYRFTTIQEHSMNDTRTYVRFSHNFAAFVILTI